MSPAWFPNAALVEPPPCLSSRPICHPKAAPKGAHSSTCKKEDATGSQTLSHREYQHWSVSYGTIPIPKFFSLKVVEGEIKRALPAEQPGKGAQRGEEPSAGKSHACPARLPTLQRTKGQKNKDKRA